VDFDTRKAGGGVDILPWIILGAVWVLAATGTGFLLALLARRLHPTLSLVRLWFFYTVLMSVLVAVVLLIIWF
jgi:hypothetical protein